jgi:hypothetical protein
MRRKLPANRENIAWLLLGSGLTLWVVTAAQHGSTSLILTAPFLQLGFSFWMGLLLTVTVFFLGAPIQRLWAAMLAAFYFIATISFMYPYAVMHDSIINAIVFPQGAMVINPYGQSYAVFGSLIAFVLRVSGSDPWAVARFFPVGMTIGYILTLGLIILTWRDRLFSSTNSSLMFIFFFFVFGDVFYLRINASPQTIGFLLFLVALGLIPIASYSIWLRGLLLLDLGVIIVLHPTTPLLALPGLIVATFISTDMGKGSIQKTLGFAGTFAIAYAAWTMYQADWIFEQAVRIVLTAFQYEKRLPIVDSPVVPQIEAYVLMHRILLIGVLILLILSYLYLWRTKVWGFITIWGCALIPAFLLFFSYRDFFDRVLLFALFPCAVMFAEAWERLRERFRTWKIRVPVATLLASLVLLAASIAYFGIGAVDRVTQSEVAALEFLDSMPGPIHVYANGFNLPISSKFQYVLAARGSLHWEDIDQADAVVLSQQMINAVLLNPAPGHSLDELWEILLRDFQEVYNNGEVQIFLRKTSHAG